jgi:hypothetical protein
VSTRDEFELIHTPKTGAFFNGFVILDESGFNADRRASWNEVEVEDRGKLSWALGAKPGFPTGIVLRRQ